VKYLVGKEHSSYDSKDKVEMSFKEDTDKTRSD